MAQRLPWRDNNKMDIKTETVMKKKENDGGFHCKDCLMFEKSGGFTYCLAMDLYTGVKGDSEVCDDFITKY